MRARVSSLATDASAWPPRSAATQSGAVVKLWISIGGALRAISAALTSRSLPSW